MVTMNRVRIVYSGVPGSPWYSNLYSVSSLTTPQQAFVQAVALVTALRAMQPTNLNITTEGDVALVNSENGEIIGVDSRPSSVLQGTSSGSRAPAATQILVRALTGAFIDGRQVRGRFYVPGIYQTAIGSDGTVTSQAQSLVSTAFTQYLATANASPVVWARKSGSAVPVAAFTVWNQFSVLRSRRD